MLCHIEGGLSKPVNPQELRRAAGVATPSGSLAFPHLLPGLPQLRKKGGSFLRPVSPKLLEIGPEVCAVFVVLDADKCHAGARHFLHRRADIFGEGLLAPGDAGRFIGWGVVEPSKVPLLRPSMPLSGGPSLLFGAFPHPLEGGDKTPPPP